MGKRIRDFKMRLFSVPASHSRQRHPNLFRLYHWLVPSYRIRRALFDLREKLSHGIAGDVECSAVIHGTPIRMIDANKYEYYSRLSRGEPHEPALTRRLTELFDEYETPTFVDIGAHFGYFTVYAGKRLAGKGRVIAVEPHPSSYAYLLKNMALNDLTGRVQPFQLALADRAGRGKMTGWDERVLSEEDDGGVEVLSFDRFCAEHDVHPDIVKIDVHGAEGKILSGMERMLKDEVGHLFCELHGDMLGYTAADLVALLEQAGMSVYEFTQHRDPRGGAVVPIGREFLEQPVDRVLYARRQPSKDMGV
jgi:FkbM family methyltransferase